MTFVLVDTRSGDMVDRASSMSELEAMKHSLPERTERPVEAWTIMPIADFNAFVASSPNCRCPHECGH